MGERLRSLVYGKTFSKATAPPKPFTSAPALSALGTPRTPAVRPWTPGTPGSNYGSFWGDSTALCQPARFIANHIQSAHQLTTTRSERHHRDRGLAYRLPGHCRPSRRTHPHPPVPGDRGGIVDNSSLEMTLIAPKVEDSGVYVCRSKFRVTRTLDQSDLGEVMRLIFVALFF